MPLTFSDLQARNKPLADRFEAHMARTGHGVPPGLAITPAFLRTQRDGLADTPVIDGMNDQTPGFPALHTSFVNEANQIFDAVATEVTQARNDPARPYIFADFASDEAHVARSLKAVAKEAGITIDDNQAFTPDYLDSLKQDISQTTTVGGQNAANNPDFQDDKAALIKRADNMVRLAKDKLNKQQNDQSEHYDRLKAQLTPQEQRTLDSLVKQKEDCEKNLLQAYDKDVSIAKELKSLRKDLDRLSLTMFGEGQSSNTDELRVFADIAMRTLDAAVKNQHVQRERDRINKKIGALRSDRRQNDQQITQQQDNIDAFETKIVALEQRAQLRVQGANSSARNASGAAQSDSLHINPEDEQDLTQTGGRSSGDPSLSDEDTHADDVDDSSASMSTDLRTGATRPLAGPDGVGVTAVPVVPSAPPLPTSEARSGAPSFLSRVSGANPTNMPPVPTGTAARQDDEQQTIIVPKSGK